MTKELLLKKLPATKTSFGMSVDMEKLYKDVDLEDCFIILFRRKFAQGGITPFKHLLLHQVYKEDLEKLFEEYEDIYFMIANVNDWIKVKEK